MSVYFVYRCPYVAPAGIHRKRFDGDSVLDWFRDHWHQLADYEVGKELLGCYVYRSPCIDGEAEEPLPTPGTPAEWAALLGQGLYVNELRCDSPHLLQGCTDDD